MEWNLLGDRAGRVGVLSLSRTVRRFGNMASFTLRFTRGSAISAATCNCLPESRMAAPDRDESKPRRRWTTSWAIVLVLVFVVYPLSSGPANVLLHHVHPNVQAVIRVIYAPLGLVL